MPTTKTKPNALGQLEKLEAVAAEKQAEAREIGRKLTDAENRHTALTDERNRLIHRDPRLVDHHGAPVGKNAVHKIDAELAKLPDLGELTGQVVHARSVEAAARQDVEEFIREHYAELAEAFGPAGREVVAAVVEAVNIVREALDDYLDMHRRSSGLTHPVQGITSHVVPGLDEASDLKRILDRIADLPVPTPVIS